MSCFIGHVYDGISAKSNSSSTRFIPGPTDAPCRRTTPRTDQPPCPSRRSPARRPAPAPLILGRAWAQQSIVLTLSPRHSHLVEREFHNPAPSRDLPAYRDKELHFRRPWLQPVLDECLQSRPQTRIHPHSSVSSNKHLRRSAL